MRTLTETNAEVTFNQSLKAVEVFWNGFADTEEYKRVLEHSLLIIRDYKCTAWISDMTHGKAIPGEAMEFLKKIFVIRAMQAGIKKIGFVVTNNAFAKLYASSLKSITKQHGVDMNYFDSRKELEHWILS